jgi:muconate cycloisomerase
LDALRSKLAPAAIGLDASSIHVLTARLDAAMPGFFDAKAAIEMACVDLTARPYPLRNSQARDRNRRQ